MSTYSSPKKPASTMQRGRPREFDVASVSEAAARVFWERGYHSTSLDDLTEATGLLRGSLYGAFGDKRGMLLVALDHYAEGAIAGLSERLNSGLPPHEALREALLHHTRVVGPDRHPRLFHHEYHAGDAAQRSGSGVADRVDHAPDLDVARGSGHSRAS